MNPLDWFFTDGLLLAAIVLAVGIVPFMAWKMHQWQRKARENQEAGK